MDRLQNTLIRALYKIRKSGVDLVYPIPNERLKEVITDLLDTYHFHCKVKPRINARAFEKRGIVKNTSTIVEMAVVHLDKAGHESSPTKVTLYFDSYINEEDTPEYAISGIFKNKFKEAIYRPAKVQSEADVVSYVKNILNELSHRL